MTPLERAARALYKDYVEGRIRMGVKPSDLPAWEDLGQDGEFAFYAPARAVIEAIREPSEAVRKAMRQTIPVTGHDWEYNDPVVSNGVVIDDEPGDCWRAMIDALLEEGT